MSFREYLANECHIPEKKIPYFLKWVNIFKKYDENHDLFLSFMQETYQDWQVSQALTAVQMYKRYLHNQGAQSVQKEKITITSGRDMSLSKKAEMTYIRIFCFNEKSGFIGSKLRRREAQGRYAQFKVRNYEKLTVRTLSPNARIHNEIVI